MLTATDFLESESRMDGTQRVVPLAAIWHCLIEGLNPIWPSRIQLGGVSLGDVWPCTALKSESTPQGDDLVPFHKLTMWITYSIIEVFQRVANWRVEGLEDMTGLPEYRNGTQILVRIRLHGSSLHMLNMQEACSLIMVF